MRIAAAQMACAVGDVPANLKKIEKIIEKAAGKNCDAVVFPETSDTGYDRNAAVEKASGWDGGPLERIRQAAQAHRICVFCGLSEREAGRTFNSVAVVGPDGDLLGRYRKTHLAAFHPLNEDRIFAPGDALEVFDVSGMRCGPMICYDLRFPEISRTLALRGAQILVLCSAWPFPRLRHWETLIHARAIENQVFVVAANQTGSNKQVSFCGSSRIVDPFGVALAAASEESESLVVAEIDPDRLKAVRNAMPVFRHRRQDIYETS